MQLQTLHLASDGTRLVAPNLVSALRSFVCSGLPWQDIWALKAVHTCPCQPCRPFLVLFSRACRLLLIKNEYTKKHLMLSYALQLRTGVTMVQTEGYAALMSGVSATVARGLFYGGALPACSLLQCSLLPCQAFVLLHALICNSIALLLRCSASQLGQPVVEGLNPAVK